MENYHTLHIDFSKASGVIKPMNCVNNGPAGSEVRGTSNFPAYRALEIPYARIHDASFYSGYGGEFAVDVHRIFRNFDADENLPESYSFRSTDEYLKNIQSVGTETFYRLGCNIEHGEKEGTYPPKDFAKWARICEHIIRHYNEGWANGFHYNLQYWEIWNEPECYNRDGTNPCWQGTEEQFAEFFCIVAKHLKASFPELKIGGPAICTVWSDHAENIKNGIVKRGAPLDFVSYHWYGKKPEDLAKTIEKADEFFADFPKAERILNEWNYIRGWFADEWRYSLASEKGLKGASFIGACMSVGQASKLDMLMYYDARPCGMNGMFNTDTLAPLPGYYPFVAFREIKKLGTAVPTEQNYKDGIYSTASTNGTESALMVTYFDEDENAETKNVQLSFENLAHSGKVKVQCYLQDESHNLDLMREEIFTAGTFSLFMPMKLYSTVLVKVLPLR